MDIRTTLVQAAAVLLPSLLPGQGQCLYTARGTLNLNTGSAPVYSLTLAADELTIVFASVLTGGLGGYDLWLATRANVFAAWSPPVNLTALNSPQDDWEPCLSFDGQEILFASNRPGGPGPSNLLTAPRSGGSFGPPQLVPGLVNGPGLDNHDPYLTADRRTLYFTAPGAGGYDLYTAVRANTLPGTPWLAKTPFAIANSTASDHSPMPEGDGGVVFFASNRPGGPGRSDFYVTWRSGTTWTTPILATDVSTADWDSNGHLGATTGAFYVTVSPMGTASRGDGLCPCPNPLVVAGRAPGVQAWGLTLPLPPLVREYAWSAAIGSTLTLAIGDWRRPPPPPPPELGFLFLAPGSSVCPPFVSVPGFRSGLSVLPTLGMLGPFVESSLKVITAPLPIPNDPALRGAQVSLQLVRIDVTTLTGAFSHPGRVRIF